MSYSDDLTAFINAVVEDKAKEMLARKSGRPVPGGVGSSLGGVSGETEGAIDQGAGGDDSDEKMEKLTDKLSPGDKPEKFKLFDCDTNEEVTIDGVGGNEIKPVYPTGFENCTDPNKDNDPSFVWYYEMRTKNGLVVASKEYTKSYETAIAWITSKPREGWIIPPNSVKSNGYVNAQCSNSSGIPISDPSYREWTVTCFNKNITPPPDGSLEIKWPAVDKNHLVWNEEKACMEPLCAELNTQVSSKYQGCNDEMVLCDEDGNKVKVKIENGEMKVTQAKFNQEATIKDGKVQSTKPLTAEQTARELFK